MTIDEARQGNEQLSPREAARKRMSATLDAALQNLRDKDEVGKRDPDKKFELTSGYLVHSLPSAEGSVQTIHPIARRGETGEDVIFYGESFQKTLSLRRQRDGSITVEWPGEGKMNYPTALAATYNPENGQFEMNDMRQPYATRDRGVTIIDPMASGGGGWGGPKPEQYIRGLTAQVYNDPAGMEAIEKAWNAGQQIGEGR